MPERDFTFRFGADTGPLDRGLGRSERNVKRHGAALKRSYGNIARSASRKLSRALLNPITGLASGAGVLLAGKRIVDFDSKVSRLAIQARLGAKEQMALRKEIIDTGLATRQSREDVLAGVNAIVERLGDMDLARALMKDMGIAATATGARMEDIGALAANLYDKMGLAKNEIRGALNLLTSQGKTGSFTLENMAAMGERLFSAAAGFNIKGQAGLRSFGAFVQMARKGTGSAEMATTAVERTLSVLLGKANQIKQLTGFEIFDPQKSTKQVKVAKEFETVLKGIIEGSGGDALTLQKIFGDEAIRAIRPLATLYRETGKFELFEAFKDADLGRQNELLVDFERYSRGSAAAFKMLGGVVTKIADVALSDGIDSMAESLNKFASDPEKMRRLAEDIGAIGSAASLLARGLLKSAEGLSLLMRMSTKKIERPVWMERTEGMLNPWHENFIGSESRRRNMAALDRLPSPAERKAYQNDPQAATESFLGRRNEIMTNVNVVVHGDGRVSADTTSTGGNAHTKVSTLPRGEF